VGTKKILLLLVARPLFRQVLTSYTLGAILYHIKKFLAEWFTSLRWGEWAGVLEFVSTTLRCESRERWTMRKIILGTLWIAVAAVVFVTGPALSDDDADEKGIELAVQNYVSALYDMKPELLDGSVSPRLQKLGYMPAQDGSGLEESWMTFDELRDLAGHLNKDGMFDPETSPRDVIILRRTDMIATVELIAAWGVDYIHLTKSSGEWMIMNVIWQMSSP